MLRKQVRLMHNRLPRAAKIAGSASSILFVATLVGCSNLADSYEARLADYLTETGAKMYGAYWCPHCAVQKDYFGGAATQIPYVECDPEGFGAQVELCDSVGIEAYPTWIIGGEYYQGAQPLGELATLSGFESPTD